MSLRWEVQQLAAEFAQTPEGRGIRRPWARHAWIRQHLANERCRAAAIAVLRRRKVRSPSLDYFSKTWPTIPGKLRRRAAERAVAMLDADTVVPVPHARASRPGISHQPAPWDGGVSGVALLLSPLAALAGALYLILDLYGADTAEIALSAVLLLAVGGVGMLLAVLRTRR